MKPEKQLKQLKQLAEYYLLQHEVTQMMCDAYDYHACNAQSHVLYALFEYELAKDQLAEFWPRFHPHYCRALRLKNGEME